MLYDMLRGGTLEANYDPTDYEISYAAIRHRILDEIGCRHIQQLHANSKNFQ